MCLNQALLWGLILPSLSFKTHFLHFKKVLFFHIFFLHSALILHLVTWYKTNKWDTFVPPVTSVITIVLDDNGNGNSWVYQLRSVTILQKGVELMLIIEIMIRLRKKQTNTQKKVVLPSRVKIVNWFGRPIFESTQFQTYFAWSHHIKAVFTR